MSEPKLIELSTIFGTQTVNAWLLKEPEPVLIDCGEKTERNWDLLQKGLAKEGLKVGDLSKVIITHAHLDHMGMAGKITENSDATIWVSDYAYDWAVDLKRMLDLREKAFFEIFEQTVGNPDNIGGYRVGYKELSPMWDEIPENRLQRFAMNDTLNFGGGAWEVIFTPGHCINQTCFYQRENQFLISADMLMKRTPSPIIDADIGEPFRRTKSMKMLLDSFDKLSELDIKKAFPGHYEILENVSQVIEIQVDRILKKKEICFDLIKNGSSEFMELFQTMYPNRNYPPTYFMVVGFLDLLIEEERIEVRKEGAKISYFVKS